MHPYVKAWADILVHGFLLLPWYIFEWIISGFDSKVICLPVKRYWSMNGKNVTEDNKGIAVPFGILEGLAFAATAAAMFYFNKAACMDSPIAFADAAKLLLPMDGATGAFANKAVVRSSTDYPSYSAFKNFGPGSKFCHFWGFSSKIFGQKNDFSKLPHKTSPQGEQF